MWRRSRAGDGEKCFLDKILQPVAAASEIVAQRIEVAKENCLWYDGFASGASLYNYFRDYNPQTGRYVQSDPIGLAAGENTFSYVANDPIYAADPLGLYNPWGRRGSLAHRQKIDELEKHFRGKGCSVVCGGSVPEQKFGNRFPDLVMQNKSGAKFAIQVGKGTQKRLPIKRERDAMCDLRKNPEFKHVFFFKYK